MLGALFLIGTAEVFVDTAAGTLMPMLVAQARPRRRPGAAADGFITLNQLAGAPIGAALFATGRALPFGVQVVTVLLAAVLVTRIALPPGPVRERRHTHVRRDIAEGVRWLFGHPPSAPWPS